jgi:2-polyprenyl-3-methyl-5-hydroxy-6-metoxy-1,4-benzoquinol methylase
MVEFWDEKYAGEHFHYGKEPNSFFKEYIDNLTDKKLEILFPADGEGRNSVYAAGKGHNTYSFDQSKEAQKKALKLAKERNVSINYDVSDVMAYDTKHKFDLIVMIYFHLPAELRIAAHRKFIDMLSKNGIILIEAFNKKQINNNSGGPKNIDMLYSAEELKSDFSSIKIKLLEEKTIHLNESDSHTGDADIIRLIASKS